LTQFNSDLLVRSQALFPSWAAWQDAPFSFQLEQLQFVERLEPQWLVGLEAVRPQVAFACIPG